MSDFTTPVLHLLFAARRGTLTRITGMLRSTVQSSSEEVAEFFLIMTPGCDHPTFWRNEGLIFSMCALIWNLLNFFLILLRYGCCFKRFLQKFSLSYICNIMICVARFEENKYNVKLIILNDKREIIASTIKLERREQEQDKSAFARSQSIISQRRKIKPAAHNPPVIPNTRPRRQERITLVRNFVR